MLAWSCCAVSDTHENIPGVGVGVGVGIGVGGIGVGVGGVGVGVGLGVCDGVGDGLGFGFGAGTGLPLPALPQELSMNHLIVPTCMFTNAGIELDKNTPLLKVFHMFPNGVDVA